jgi:hypothetical protein
MNIRHLARKLAHSRFLANGRTLWEKNRADWNLSMSKMEKLQVGVHVILSDFADRRFPPTFDDQQAAYDGEIAYRQTKALLVWICRPWVFWRFDKLNEGF